MAKATQKDRVGANQAFVTLAAAFAILFSIAFTLLAFDQHRVLQSAEQLQEITVPEIIRYQRLARNIEQLRQEGEHVFSASKDEERQQALFIVMLVASHPSILENESAAIAAREAEAMLTDASRLADRDPVLFKVRYAEWQQHSRRLGLLVDDLTVQGAGRVAEDLAQMSVVMHLSRYKLVGTLALVGIFLVLSMWLLRRHLVRPLQRIDQTLSSLNVNEYSPVFPETQLNEIYAIEQATVRLHRLLQENEASRRDLEQQATLDSLTGLMNRRHFMAKAEAELRRAERYGHPVAIALGDLDHFKHLNDTYGHAAGDIVLRAFAALLTESVRESDLVCRYGGEEFVLLFPESTTEQARVLMERFRHRFSEFDVALPDGLLLRVTLSIGIADASHGPLENALQRADDALYEAKWQGRNRVVVAIE